MAGRRKGGQNDLFGEGDRFNDAVLAILAELRGQGQAPNARDVTRVLVRRHYWLPEDEEETLVRAHVKEVEDALKSPDLTGLPIAAPAADGGWKTRSLFDADDYDAYIIDLMQHGKDVQRKARRWKAEMEYRFGWSTDISSLWRDDEGGERAA